MKLWIYSHLQRSPGNRLMMEAAQKRGHQATLIEPSSLHALITPTQGFPFFSTEGRLERPDLIYTRTGSSAPEEALDLLRRMEDLPIPLLNTSYSLWQSRDKVRCFQALAQAGVALPQTALVSKTSSLGALVEQIPGPPWIVKLPRSTKGQGVMLVESLRSLKSAVDVLRSLDQRILLQEFINEAAGSDVRVLVVGGKALAGMRRQAQGSEFRSNLHQGGSGAPVSLSPSMIQIAQDAAITLGLEIAGVDLLESHRGPLIVEVNGSPGIEGLSAATGRDLAEEILVYLEQRGSSDPRPEKKHTQALSPRSP